MFNFSKNYRIMISVSKRLCYHTRRHNDITFRRSGDMITLNNNVCWSEAPALSVHKVEAIGQVHTVSSDRVRMI